MYLSVDYLLVYRSREIRGKYGCIYTVFHLNATLTTTEFVSFGDISVTVGVLLSHLVLVRMRFAKCFMSSSKQFWCKIMFMNDHVLCSWMSMCYAHEYTVFAPAQLLLNWHVQWPSNLGDLDLGVMGEVCREYYVGVDLFPI